MKKNKDIQKIQSTGEDRFDVFIGHIINGNALTEKQQERFEVMLKVNSLLCAGWSKEKVLKLLTNQKSMEVAKINNGISVSLVHAYRILHDTFAVFGDISKVSKDGKRHILYENFMRLAEKAENAGDHNSAINACHKAALLFDLYNSDTVLIDPTRFMYPVNIVMVNDSRALQEDEEAKQIILQEIENVFQYNS